MKKDEGLFAAVCGGFSAILIVLSLLVNTRLAAVNDAAAATKQQVEALETENAILRAQAESSVSLEEIERYAIETLGMQRCAPGQIYYIELPED